MEGHDASRNVYSIELIDRPRSNATAPTQKRDVFAIVKVGLCALARRSFGVETDFFSSSRICMLPTTRMRLNLESPDLAACKRWGPLFEILNKKFANVCVPHVYLSHDEMSVLKKCQKFENFRI
jgi:hypothetical protein